jgi:DNA-binding IclR family transcriptional regulator
LLDGSEIVYLEKIASPQPVRADSTVGCRATVHCVATGEVLLACAGSEALAQLSVPLRRPTRHTVADLCALERQIEQVARNGYAVNREEWRLGVSGLGAAVYDQCGQEIAAAGLSAPTARLDDNRNHTLGLALATTASEITRAFGGRVPIETAVPTSPKHLERQHR